MMTRGDGCCLARLTLIRPRLFIVHGTTHARLCAFGTLFLCFCVCAVWSVPGRVVWGPTPSTQYFKASRTALAFTENTEHWAV